MHDQNVKIKKNIENEESSGGEIKSSSHQF